MTATRQQEQPPQPQAQLQSSSRAQQQQNQDGPSPTTTAIGPAPSLDATVSSSSDPAAGMSSSSLAAGPQPLPGGGAAREMAEEEAAQALAPLHRTDTFPNTPTTVLPSAVPPPLRFEHSANYNHGAPVGVGVGGVGGGAGGNNGDMDMDIALLVPRGLRIRDEFLCPITRELIVEPVIAADGHTYDRGAIERWIHRSTSRSRSRSSRNDPSAPNTVTSPKTGQPFDHLHLIPNHNLKRLLKDMIREGGNGLWCREDGSSALANDFVPQPTAVMTMVAAPRVSSPVPAPMCSPPLSPAASFASPLSRDSMISPASTDVGEAGVPSGGMGGGAHGGGVDGSGGGGINASNRGGLLVDTVGHAHNLGARQFAPGVIQRAVSPLSPSTSSVAGSVGAASPPLSPLHNTTPGVLSPATAVPTPRLALVRTRVVRCRCLGPPESDWNGRSFRFAEPHRSSSHTSNPPGHPTQPTQHPSLMGGRRRPHEGAGGGAAASSPVSGDDFVQFADATVSRKHFELRFVSEEELRSEDGRRGVGKLADFGGDILRGCVDEGDEEAGGNNGNVGSSDDEEGLRRLLRRRLSSREGGGGTNNGGRRRGGWFVLRDLGSAGGTFVRTPPGRGARLSPGSMIMLGKHQLVALAPPPSPSPATETPDGPSAAAEGEEERHGDAEGSCVAAEDRASSSGSGRPAALTAAALGSREALAAPSDNDRPLSPSSVVAGTDIVTPMYGDPRLEREGGRFFFTERRRNEEESAASRARSPTSALPYAASSSRRTGGDLSLPAASVRGLSAAGLSGAPDLNETLAEEEEEAARMAASNYRARDDNDDDSGDSDENDDSEEDDKRDEDPQNVDVEVVAQDDGDDEVEVVEIVAQEGRTVRRQRSGRTSARMTAGDLGLELPDLSNAATTDAEDGASSAAEYDRQEEGDRARRPQEEGNGGESTPEEDDGKPLLVLRCFAPEGTPLQGREYALTKSGATLGRKATNTISFSHRVGAEDLMVRGQDESAANEEGVPPHLGAYVGIDSSISGEHACVSYDADDGCLRLWDGSALASGAGGRRGAARGSTNGTWIRLSAMHEKSGWFVLEDRMEVLVGTVRFQVEMDEIVVERDIYD